jgi:hypothetical protein
MGSAAAAATSTSLRFALSSAFIAVKLCPPRSPTSLPADAVLLVRATLQLVLETRIKGTAIWLWVWLYYAFTAPAVLFVYSVSDPLNADMVLNLALLDELRGLCVL